jgi:hypothetical protein
MVLFPSHASSLGLSIHASNSILATGSVTGYQMDDSIAQRISSYNHEIGANGGYLSASFTISNYVDEVNDWLSYGLGRHIEVFDEFHVKVWEGFINQVAVSISGLSITRGPLMNIANRGKAIYQTIRYDTNPPIGGNQAITDEVNFTTSQEKYGIFEDMVSIGEATLDMAEYLRNTYFQEKKDPETTTQVNIGTASSDVSIRIDCLGYYKILETYFYTNTSPVTNTVATNTKLLAVFAAQPNSIFSTNDVNIEDSGLTVGFFERGDRRGSEIVSGLVAPGNTTQDRFICGVLNDRTIYYKQIPEEILYEYKINDNSKRVDMIGGVIQSYWSIQSGKWLTVPDLLIGEEQLRAIKPLREDIRNVFLESVQYSMPYNLNLVGGKVARMPQLFAQLGIASL